MKVSRRDLLGATDERLVRTVLERLESDYPGLRRAPRELHVFFSAIVCDDSIKNDGMWLHLFNVAGGATAVAAESFRTMGANDAAAILEEVVSTFGEEDVFDANAPFADEGRRERRILALARHAGVVSGADAGRDAAGRIREDVLMAVTSAPAGAAYRERYLSYRHLDVISAIAAYVDAHASVFLTD